VAGAAGFLGSHISSHYLAKGDIVWGIDNFCSSDCDSMHLKILLNNPQFGFFMHDVRTFDDREWHRLYNGVDIIYNMACPASPPIYQSMPIETITTCVNGTVNMIKLAQAMGAAIVHASTSEIYGDPNCDTQSESYWGNVNSYGQRSCYDEGKRGSEAICYDYLNKYNVDVRVARIFNTYGSRMRQNDGRVVSNFICQRLRGDKMTIYGDGSQTRSFCYVDDMVRGLIALGEFHLNPRSPVNLGNPCKITVRSLAQSVIEKIEPEREQHYTLSAFPTDDPHTRCPDISIARQLLGWQPKISLDEGLTRTIEYFKTVI